MNPFFENQKVVCISENFKKIITTETDKSTLGKQAYLHPKKGQTYIIDEILGDYLNFRQFNTPDGIEWFHYSRFAAPENVAMEDFNNALNENELPHEKVKVWIDESVPLFGSTPDNFKVRSFSLLGRKVWTNKTIDCTKLKGEGGGSFRELFSGSFSEKERRWWANYQEMKKPIELRDESKLLDISEQLLTLSEFLAKK